MTDDSSLPPRSGLSRWLKLAGLSARLSGDALSQGLKKLTGQEAELLSLSSAERVVATLGDMKGAAMKLGQMLSLDSSLLTPEVQSVLGRLQNEAPPMDYETVVDVVVDALGDDPQRVFARFDREPCAAASLGQVHRANLRDGRPVAVKVQYPGIHEAMASDVKAMGMLVGALAAANRQLDRREYFDEVRRELQAELDYREEARRRDAFARAARGFPELLIPAVVPELSTQRVLTLEWVEGPTLKDVMVESVDSAERLRISRLLIRGLHGPLLAAGVMHADPHPGNFIVAPDGRLGILDFGAVKTFSAGFREGLWRLFDAALADRRPDIYVLLKTLGFEMELTAEEAAPLVEELTDILLRPFSTRDFDCATDTSFLDVKRLSARHMGRLLKIRPPLESPLYGRAVAGLTMNLRRLGARGDFRAIYEELARDTERERPPVR